MAFIDWTAKFSVGSLTLDQQHKSLIEIINKLHAAMLQGGDARDLQRIFQDLIAYTQSHFNAEEGILRQTDYPNLASHHREHVEFVQKARDLHAQLIAGKFTVSMELLRFLKTWLSEHILGTDQQYAAYLKPEKYSAAGRS
jgi:hemerythrin-like metal-binding protein